MTSGTQLAPQAGDLAAATRAGIPRRTVSRTCAPMTHAHIAHVPTVEDIETAIRRRMTAAEKLAVMQSL